MEISGLGKFETYPNRNSTQYIDIYKIPETKTIIRGTYRYPGNFFFMVKKNLFFFSHNFFFNIFFLFK